MKILTFLFLFVLGAAYAMGWRVHPENFSYYFPSRDDEGNQRFILMDGQVLEGQAVEETSTGYRIRTQGVILEVTKNEITGVEEMKENFFTRFQKRFEDQLVLHPLIGQDRKQSFKNAMDELLSKAGKGSRSSIQGQINDTGDKQIDANVDKIRDLYSKNMPDVEGAAEENN